MALLCVNLNRLNVTTQNSLMCFPSGCTTGKVLAKRNQGKLQPLADQLIQLTATKQLPGMQVLHFPLDPPLGSRTPEPGICASIHNEEPQLPQNFFMNKGGVNKMEMGFSLISWGSAHALSSSMFAIFPLSLSPLWT